MQQHVKLLGILFIVSGILSIMFGFMMIAGLSFLGLISGEREAIAVLSIIGIICASFCFVTGIPEIIGGWGLLKKQKWSRILVIIMAIINIFNVPFGTALGIYALWILFKPEAEQILSE